jgi:hypothetical protein
MDGTKDTMTNYLDAVDLETHDAAYAKGHRYRRGMEEPPESMRLPPQPAPVLLRQELADFREVDPIARRRLLEHKAYFARKTWEKTDFPIRVRVCGRDNRGGVRERIRTLLETLDQKPGWIQHLIDQIEGRQPADFTSATPEETAATDWLAVWPEIGQARRSPSWPPWPRLTASARRSTG